MLGMHWPAEHTMLGTVLQVSEVTPPSTHARTCWTSIQSGGLVGEQVVPQAPLLQI
jgi:hypothetical protein